MTAGPVYLAGFMGVGKSTIGTLLARKLGTTFLDLDQIIVEHEGMSINDIFREKGEAYFRDVEASLLEGVAKSEAVIALGGGTLMNRESLELLKCSGIIVYLRASNETLVRRLRAETSARPLLQQGESLEDTVERIMRERVATYETAPVIVDVDGLSSTEVVDAILGVISTLKDL